MSNKSGKVTVKIRNDAQLSKTLGLIGIVGEKPHVNDVMPLIMERIDEEERAKMAKIARRWCGRDWSDYMLYDCFGGDYPGYDDEEGYDPYEEIYDGLGSKNSRKIKSLNKKLFKGKKNKKRYSGSDDNDDFWEHRHTMYSRKDWDDDLDNDGNYESFEKSIKFYSDIENELYVREFNSLKSFSDFCDDNGYKIGPTDYSNLVNWSVIHCCLDPISLEYGENEIITDNSYGALYWTVCEDITKYKGSSVNSSSSISK